MQIWAHQRQSIVKSEIHESGPCKTPGVNFIKSKHQNLFSKCINILFMVFSMFNFIKSLIPKFSQHNAKKWKRFCVKFHNSNLALKIQNGQLICLIWQHADQKMLPKSGVLNAKQSFDVFSSI